MKRQLSLITAITTAIIFSLTSCASNKASSSNNKKAEVPSLVIKTACGNCKISASIAALIQESYIKKAAQSGMLISKDTQATLTINNYSERNLTMRTVSVIAEPLAIAFDIKDEIVANVSFKEKSFAIEYNKMNPFQGIESVANEIAEMTFEKLEIN